MLLEKIVHRKKGPHIYSYIVFIYEGVFKRLLGATSYWTLLVRRF